MKKLGVLLLVALAATGCADDNDFDFNGTWLVEHTIHDRRCATEPVAGRIKIVVQEKSYSAGQLGRMTVEYLDDPDKTPHPGTVSSYPIELWDVQYTTASGVSVRWHAQRGEDPSTMGGAYTADDVRTGCYVMSTWRADLQSR